MKKLLLFAILSGMAATAMADGDIITLDLTKATTELTFNATTGAWDGTFNDDEEVIESQCFLFLHNSMSDYQTWWGFTASNSADNAMRDNYITYQYSNMAKGGILLKEDGTVDLDEYGAPKCSASVPYLVAYCSSMMAAHPAQIIFNDGNNYEPQGCYVNLNSWAYYTIQDGSAMSRAFTNGDNFTLTIHGVAQDESEKTVEVTLAKYDNGDLTLNRGWRYVDLTPLGEVSEIYFSMKSTDASVYGDNTPDYFCLDKLQVKPVDSDPTAVNGIAADGRGNIRYDRATKMVSVQGADFAAVYDTAGSMVMSSEQPAFSLEYLPAGVYVVKAGNARIKIAR